jgi:hypothetical protein
MNWARRLKEATVAVAASLGLVLTVARVAGAAPGENFPEQPGDNLAQGCPVDRDQPRSRTELRDRRAAHVGHGGRDPRPTVRGCVPRVAMAR